VRLVGADRVLLGSDYCFDMGLAAPVQTVSRLTELSQAERDQILGRNAARLLGLG
jgi:aminocarboxymuconate-semialdehyde decarboxylase